MTCSIVSPQASFSAPNAVLRIHFKMLWLYSIYAFGPNVFFYMLFFRLVYTAFGNNLCGSLHCRLQVHYWPHFGAVYLTKRFEIKVEWTCWHLPRCIKAFFAKTKRHKQHTLWDVVCIGLLVAQWLLLVISVITVIIIIAVAVCQLFYRVNEWMNEWMTWPNRLSNISVATSICMVHKNANFI